MIHRESTALRRSAVSQSGDRAAVGFSDVILSRSFLAFAAVLVIAAPLSAVDAQTPTTAPDGAVAAAPVAKEDIQHPLTLTDSIALALRESHPALAARFARDAARSDADRQRPRIQPTVTATVDATVQGPGVTLHTKEDDNFLYLPDRTAALDLVMIEPIYQPGLDAARVRYAAQVRVVESNYKKDLVDIALGVNRAYLAVLKAGSGLRIARDGLESTLAYQSLVLKQVQAGKARPVDAQMVAEQTAESQSGVLKAESGLRSADEAFNHTLSRPLDTPVVLETPGPLPIVPESPAGAVAVALQNRPELVSLQQMVESTKAGVLLADSQRYPSFSIKGQVIEQSPTSFVNSTYAAATFEVRWSILDAGKSEQDIKQARNSVGRLEEQLLDARQGIELDVTQAWERMRAAKEQLGLAREQSRADEATLTVAEKAYEVGRGTVFEVRNAGREFRSAKERELEATFDLRSAGVEFQYAQGLGLPTLSPAGPIPAQQRLRHTTIKVEPTGDRRP